METFDPFMFGQAIAAQFIPRVGVPVIEIDDVVGRGMVRHLAFLMVGSS